MRDSYEIINNGQVTPQRLHALVRLVMRLDGVTREEILNYLQPNSISDNQDAAKAVYNAAQNCQLIAETGKSRTGVVLDRKVAGLGSIDDVHVFRKIMQERLLGQTDPDGDNYLLSLVAAWYAVSGVDVLGYDKKTVEIEFNRALFSGGERKGVQEGRAFNTTKLNSWMTWAQFLGWGWTYKGLFMPNPEGRLLSMLDEFRGREVQFGDFMTSLAAVCPELDGGVIYRKCWQAVNGSESGGQQLSLMLSTALRSMQKASLITMTRVPDATDRWWLHEVGYSPLEEVNYVYVN